MKLYSTTEAAEYLDKTVASLKYHIHVAKTLKGQLVGHSLVFTQEELDRFKRNERPPGRPPKQKPD